MSRQETLLCECRQERWKRRTSEWKGSRPRWEDTWLGGWLAGHRAGNRGHERSPGWVHRVWETMTISKDEDLHWQYVKRGSIYWAVYWLTRSSWIEWGWTEVGSVVSERTVKEKQWSSPTVINISACFTVERKGLLKTVFNKTQDFDNTTVSLANSELSDLRDWRLSH